MIPVDEEDTGEHWWQATFPDGSIAKLTDEELYTWNHESDEGNGTPEELTAAVLAFREWLKSGNHSGLSELDELLQKAGFGSIIN